MPQPVYIICSESGTMDSDTKLISLFNVIEQMTLERAPEGEQGDTKEGAIAPCRVTATWLRNEEDSEQDQYESELALYFPGAPDAPDSFNPITTSTGRFSFIKPLHRIIAKIGIAAFFGPGILRVEARLRKVGTTEWLRQSYPIILEERVAPSNAGQPQTPAVD